MPSQYVGTWVSGNVSPVNFYSPSTGSWGAPSGVGMFYKFLPNGQYEKGVLLQSTLYGCTMSVFGYQRGAIRVDGSTFELRSSTHKMKSVDNCVQKNNYEKTLDNEAETLFLRLGTDDYGNRALCSSDRRTRHQRGSTRATTERPRRIADVGSTK